MDLIFSLSDFIKYKTYFNTLATQCKSIDGFLFGDIEIGQSDSGSWQGLKLWAWPADRSKLQASNDNYLANREGEIWIGGPCTGELHADKDLFYQQCERVMKTMISRLIKDISENVISIDMHGHSLERADMDLSGTEFVGCKLQFKIVDPEGFEFIEDDWEII